MPLSLLYFVSLAALGALVPYLALELQERGLTGWTLTATLAALPAGRLIAGPLWSLAADRWRSPARVLVVASSLGLAGISTLAWGPAGLAAVAALVFSLGRAAEGPLMDSLALASLGADRLAYGRIRRWGSLGFIVAALGTGALHQRLGWSPLGLTAALSVALLALVASLRTGEPAPPARLGPALRALAADHCLRWVLFASALHFAAHVGSTTFLAVRLEQVGVGTGWAGVAIALGVSVEVVVMTWSRQILSRWGVMPIFVGAIALAVPRWVVLALAEHPAALVLQQAGHGLSFGAFWLAGVAVISQRAPEAVRTSGQGAFSAAVAGVGALVGTVVGAQVVDHWGTRALFGGMAVAALFAVAAALQAARLERRIR